MVFCSSQMLEEFSSHESKTSDLKISLAWVMNKTPYSYFRAHSICIVVKYKQAKIWLKILWNDSNTQNDEQNIMFKSQCSHMWLQKSILSHVTTLTFVVTCDYIDFFLANVTVNHNVHTFTIIVHGYLFHSCLINVVNYNGIFLS